MKAILIFLLLSVSACATPKHIYVPCEPFAFQKTEIPIERVIRIYAPDIPLYEAYIDKLREQIEFHNRQIDDYRKAQTFRARRMSWQE